MGRHILIQYSYHLQYVGPQVRFSSEPLRTFIRIILSILYFSKSK